MLNMEGFWHNFGEWKQMVLSTCEKEQVTSRMMSIIQKDGLLYFQTDKTFRKYKQLLTNPKVSLCESNIQIEGICIEIGCPKENPSFCLLYKQYFPNSFERYSFLNNERLFQVKPFRIQQWIYKEGVPFIEIYDLEKQCYSIQEYTGK